MSRFDQIYRSLILSKFFTKGWGKPENLKKIFEFRKIISNRDLCKELVSSDYPINIEKDYEQKEVRIIEGNFKSPFDEYMHGIMPPEVTTAHFQMILPKNWDATLKPVCLHLAGTGDHYFYRRRMLLAKPLLKEYGIASILLENPYYGIRKPKQQTRSALHNVSDLFVMGGALILESLVLLHWCEKNGWGPLGITGISMGGHMASLAATNWHKPLSLIPCLSWSTASSVFTQGVMQGAINWKLLKHQYDSDNVYAQEISAMLDFQKLQSEKNEKSDAFNFGRHFARTFPSVIEHSSESIERKNNQNANLENTQTVAHDFMKGVMDECTHLANFSVPVDPELIIIVAATDDAYVPRRSVLGLDELWPGVEVRYVNSGHIGAFLFKQSVFRQAIVDSFQKQVGKYFQQSMEKQN